MATSFQARNKKSLDRARLLGLGALFVGSLTACADQSSPAPSVEPSAAPVTVIAPNATSAPAAQPTAQPTAAASATSAPVATASPTETPAPAPTEAPTETPVLAPTEAPAATGRYKDGEYLGAVVRADRWGNLQVRAIIEGGQLVKIDVIEYPRSTRRSDLISRAALPTLVSEAIENQTAEVNIVSRATDTCVAFVASLEAALDDAATGNS
jgi:uncharacterized protein with FMN-binding domain